MTNEKFVMTNEKFVMTNEKFVIKNKKNRHNKRKNRHPSESWDLGNYPMKYLKKTQKKLFELFFPKHCLHCKKRLKKDILCLDCITKLKTEPTHYTRTNTLNIYSLFNYKNPIIKSIIYGLKFSNETETSKLLSKLITERIKTLPLTQTSIQIPIPSHPTRDKERGHNPVKTLFKNSVNLEETLLKRIKKTKPLYLLKRNNRKETLKNAFHIEKEEQILLKNKQIILIDDIYTSGETLKEVTQLLNNIGVKSVTGLTFCIKEHENTRN